jgi:GntR family transcriptional regulator/MocR family aminotransferase
LGLSNAILTRRIVPGMHLPPTRALALELDISRITVVTAYERLLSEGYIEGKVDDHLHPIDAASAANDLSPA